MPDRCRNFRRAACVGTLLVVCIFVLGGTRPANAAGVSYGEIEVSTETEPRGSLLHGYAEYRFQVKNRSSDRSIRVTLQMPAENDRRGRRREGSLNSISKTVEVGPGGVTSVSILQPAAPGVGGDGVAVYINGRKQDQQLMVSMAAGANPPAHVMYGRRSSRMYGYSSPKGGGNELNLLTTLRVSEEFFKVPSSIRHFGGGVMMPPGGGGPGGPIVPEPLPPPGVPAIPPKEADDPDGFLGGPGPGGPRPGGVGVPATIAPFEMQVQRSDLPISVWSGRWLAFTRFDAIVVTTEDLDELQRAGTESRAVLQALWQYTETGGVLFVLGGSKNKGKATIPAAYDRPPVVKEGLMVYPVGFGRCLVSPDRDSKKWTLERWSVLQQAASGTAMTWKSNRPFAELNKTFPIVDDLGLPVKGLFALMVLFGIAMGPANLIWLTRFKRRIWLLWTVPALSLFFCFAVLGYMVVAEGWQGHARVGGITLLDEVEKRATTLGRTGFYSPVTPGDGLRFSDTTEVQILGDENAAWTNTCSIDWTNEQHLSRGWVTARVPAFFTLRKSETVRRERINLRREDDGGLSAVNALGVDINQLWLADEKGQLYRTAGIAAGGTARLERAGPKVAPAIPLETWREIYSGQDWLDTTKKIRTAPEKYLGPGTYLAVVDSSPFLEQGLKNAKVRPSESLVLGIMADLAGKR